LIGVRTVGRKKNGEDWKLRSEYKAFVDWSNTDDGEAKVFADFWNHIQYWKNKAKEQKWGYSAYHYTAHENSAFISLAKKHQGKAGVPTVAEVREFIESDKWIDLHKVISTELIWPTENVTLKEIAKWVRFSWRDSDPSGGNSIAWYKDAIGSDEESVREANRNRLLEYNADDCQAQSAIRNWIYQINEINKKEGKKLPNISSLDNRFRKKIFN
jgi:predicted RecB family nuclease